jgi:diacylglycerol kinase (ATP)
MTQSFHLLVNPLSGGGSAAKAVLPVASRLHAAGAEVTITYSTGVERTRELVPLSVARGDTVVAVGGDGMVASLAGAVIGAGGTLGIAPSGRGNDFARQLGISTRPDAIARTLLGGRTRQVDVIDVDGRTTLGSVYAGVDSLASELVDAAHGWPRHLQYPYAAVRSLATFPATDYTVTVDGDQHQFRAFTVVVANSGYYGKGMHIAPQAVVDDGLLDVVVITSASRARLIRAMPLVYRGKHLAHPEVVTLRGREVAISAHGVMAYGDGEPLQPLPATARVRPGALRVLAP